MGISEEIEYATINADENTKVLRLNGRFKISRNLGGILTNIIKIKKVKIKLRKNEKISAISSLPGHKSKRHDHVCANEEEIKY